MPPVSTLPDPSPPPPAVQEITPEDFEAQIRHLRHNLPNFRLPDGMDRLHQLETDVAEHLDAILRKLGTSQHVRGVSVFDKFAAVAERPSFVMPEQQPPPPPAVLIP